MIRLTNLVKYLREKRVPMLDYKCLRKKTGLNVNGEQNEFKGREVF